MGWNGSDKVIARSTKPVDRTNGSCKNAYNKSQLTKKMFFVVGALAVLIVSILVTYLSLYNKDNNREVIQDEAKPAKKNADTPPKMVELPRNSETNVVKKLPTPPKILEPKIVKTVTNSNGAVIQDVITPDGKLERIVKPPKQVWNNAVDQLIAFALSIEPGVEAPPLPSGITNDEFRRALKKDIVINSDDSERVKEIKRRVHDTRREILAVMDETGKSFEQVLNEHRARMNQNSSLYHEALKGLKEVKQNGTPEEVAQYIEKSNELLRSQGARELPLRNLDNQNINTEETR